MYLLLTLKDHMANKRSLICILKDTGITPQLKKDVCLAKRIDYVGHVFRLGKLAGTNYFTDAFQNLKTNHDDRTEIFFVPFNLFKQFLCSLERLLSPFSRLLRKMQGR